MAVREGTRASKEFMCVSIAPDFCKSPNIVVPYSIISKFDCAVNFSTNVRFRKQWVFRHNSRLSTVLGDEAGSGGGVLSGVNKGFCRPIDGTSSKTVRANKSFVDYHEGTYMFMNCAGPDGQFNTIGRVIFLGNMLPGPVAPGPKVPKSSVSGLSSLLADIEAEVGDLDDLIGKAKQLYALAKTDWSDPAAVLGAMGGLAGIAGLQDVAELAKKGKDLYELGKKVVNTDWSDPMQALSAVAGVAKVAGMKDIAKAAGMATTVVNAIKTDWSDPRAALASATAIMKSTGLNQMVAEMASNAILDSNLPVSQAGTAPPLFPKPGSAGKDAGPAIPPSSENKPRVPITPDTYAELQRTNPIAAARYDALSSDDKSRAFIEYPKDSKDPSRAAVYVPRDGFSSTQAERDSLPNLSRHVPSGIREVFVASHEDATKGNVFGIKENEGNVYLFGGLVDLGSPDMPGAGTSTFWWVPDRILNMDMSPYYDYHDRNYYGDNVTLGDVGKILDHEMAAFKAGVNGNPLQLPLQMLYSAATTGVGLGTAAFNSVNQAILGSSGGEKPPAPGGLQVDSFSSIKDFMSGLFGESAIDPKSMVDFFGPGGCMPDSVPTLPGQTVPGGPSGPGAGTKPATGKAGAPEGDASGAGKDGVLITTKQGNPAAAAAAIEAKARASNKKALEKAQAKERAKQEQAAKERVAKQESDEGIADKDKTAEADNKLKTEDRPDDGGFVDAMKEGSDKVVKEGQKDLDTRNEQSAREADAKKSAAQNSADDLKATADQLSRDAKASAVNAQHSSEVNEAIKLNAEANDAHKSAAIADAQAKSLPSGSELPKMELPDGLKGLNKAASVLGPAGDLVQAGVGAYDAYNQFNAGQKHDALVTIGKTGGALAGGAYGAATGAAVGFAICGPPCAFIGAGVGAYGGDWLGGKAGGVVADVAADTAGIENQTPPAPD